MSERPLPTPLARIVGAERRGRRLVADMAVEDAPLRSHEPGATPPWVRLGKSFSLSSAVAIILAETARNLVLPDASDAVVLAVGVVAAFPLTAIARWWGNTILAPIAEDLSRMARRWSRNWQIDQALTSQLISPEEALEEKRRLLFADLRSIDPASR